MKKIVSVLLVTLFCAGCNYPELSVDEIRELTGPNGTINFDKYTVYSDNNGNGIINSGETVYLRVYLINNGTSTAKGVKATFSTNSTLVSGFTPTSPVDYDEIPAFASDGYVYTNLTSYTIRFAVSSSAPTGVQIPISISIVDGSSNSWTGSFNVIVQ